MEVKWCQNSVTTTFKVLPIRIGTIEAVSIAYAQEGFVHPRPQTHDLLLNILDSLNAKILEVSITDIHDKTYFAEIKLSTHEGELTLSSRPSDAIALALRSSAEIFVENSVFNDNYIEIYDEDKVDIEEFSQFIDNVSPEDFS